MPDAGRTVDGGTFFAEWDAEPDREPGAGDGI